MKKGVLLSLPFCLLLLSNSCSKENEDNLPPATQTGANTFGCFLDSKTWIPTGGGIGSGVQATAGGFFRNVDNSLNIYIRAYKENESFQIFIKHATTAGIYYLNSNTAIMPGPIYPESYGSYKIDGQDYYVTNTTQSGTVDITYADTIKGVVSGTFEMQLYQQSTGKIININKGRFDYKNH